MAGYKICHDMKNGLIHCNLRPTPLRSLSYSNRPIYSVSTDNGSHPLSVPAPDHYYIYASWIVSSLTSKLRIVYDDSRKRFVYLIHFLFSIHGMVESNFEFPRGRERKKKIGSKILLARNVEKFVRNEECKRKIPFFNTYLARQRCANKSW